MAGNLQWTMGLTDKLSGPAKTMGGALDAMSAKLRSASEAAAKLDAQKPGLVVGMPKHVRDDSAKRLADIEKGAAGAFMANMKRYDGMRDAAALEATKTKIDAATAAMNRYKAAVDKAAAASGKLASRSVMGKTDANGAGLFGQSKGAQSTVGKLAQAAGNTFGDKGANAVLGAARAFNALGNAASRAAGPLGALKSVGSGALSMLGSVASAAAAAAVAVAAVGIGLAAAGARYIVGAQMFKQSTMFALGANLGGAKQAEPAWSKISSLAYQTGSDLQATANGFNGLLAGGFKMGEAEELMRMLGDMKAMDPTANLEGMALAIKQIKMTGKLQGDELNQLGNAVNQDAVFEQLAKKLGKSKEEVLKMKEAGKITADDAIDAIKRATMARSGKALGGLAEEAAGKTLIGNIMRAKVLVDQFVSSLNIDFSPITRFLEKVGKVLTGDAGTKFGSSIEGGMNRVLGILDTITEKDIAKGFDTARGIIDGAGNAASDFAGAISTIDGWLSSVNSKTTTWGAAFTIAGTALKNVMMALEMAINPFAMLQKLCTSIGKVIARWAGDIDNAGAAASSMSLGGLGASSMGGAGSSATTGGGFEEAMRKALGLGAGDQPTAATPAPASGPTARGAAAAQGATNVTKNITIQVTANGLTFAQFEQKVGEIVESKLSEQD